MKAYGETGEPSVESVEIRNDVTQAAKKMDELQLGDGLQEDGNSADKRDTDNDELAQIDLKDPGLQEAALKIQSAFKGFKVRKHKN